MVENTAFGCLLDSPNARCERILPLPVTHLSGSACRALTSSNDLTFAGRDGFVLRVVPEHELAQFADRFDADQYEQIARVMRFGRDQQVEFLRFDTSADPVIGLPEFDE